MRLEFVVPHSDLGPVFLGRLLPCRAFVANSRLGGRSRCPESGNSGEHADSINGILRKINFTEGLQKMRMRPAILIALATSRIASGQTYTISTFAGGGLPVNIPGTSASL